MHNISRDIVVGMTCHHFWPCHLDVVQKKFHFYQYCLISVIMSDDMSSKFHGRMTLPVDMSSKFLGRTTCHLHFSVRHHVAQNVVHDDILLILTTCRNIRPKFTIFHDFMILRFHGLVLVILAFFI